jgi:hypothetical protein
MLKNAPLSAMKSASLPFIWACTIGTVPSMVTGKSGNRWTLHLPCAAAATPSAAASASARRQRALTTL